MDWEKSIKPKTKPKVLIQKPISWEQTIRIAPAKPKEFSLDEHKEAIHALIKQYVQSIKHQFKGEPGKAGVGKNGRDANQWFFLDEAPTDQGNNGDFCLCENGDVYHKESGEWSKKASLKGSKGDTKYIGGGVTEDRVNQLILLALDDVDGGSSEIISDVVEGDHTITNEDFIVFNGTADGVITMPATASRRITVKNVSAYLCTVVHNAADPSINGVSSLEIPGITGALGEANFGTSLTFIRAGGQFWIN